MSKMDIVPALILIVLTGPDGQHIELNPKEIVSIREPRTTEDHFPKGARCLINTTDGKIVVVTNTCEAVHEMIADGKQ